MGIVLRHLVQFGQISRHDGEVGRRLPHILDSLHKEAVDNLPQKNHQRKQQRKNRLKYSNKVSILLFCIYV